MLKITNLNKTFDGTHVLKDISTEFPENKTTVIVGPSGSGKSTLLRSLNFLERPESGLYDFEGELIDFSKPLTNKTILDIRKRTEMVFQGYNLFPHLTVVKNIMEGPTQVLKVSKSDAKTEALDLLDKVGLKDKAEAYPAQLSGGQAQRVAIVRSMAMHPEYIFLDEPTSALDPELELEVLKALMQIAAMNQSMIIVTHNLAFARKVADKIIFVENGTILYDGNVEGFFDSDSDRIKNFVNAMTFTNI
ncbi:amino acid ABC transporter ATP-binding protein [Lentilactobacillus sp. SPB1-3]|uniref:Amino acid ABC transporter ATP-binding protein n=1 Tax=Lentilactobacillus terminaliae TaxID=3003483 RepID=A0ACD5DEX2_9LACO|nr:amino acid ABC transporter ATP-binding protein [Lentilactobacillus sp. SPB1-3]MCZ0976279.1 amino acid ABC transporter ATP-binding protein [Lentilactobacillus sp. SPB1-3]